MVILIKKIIVLIQFLSFLSLYGEGFVAGTLVKTPTGMAPIECIQIHDYVICRDNNGAINAKPVLLVSKKPVPSYVCISCDTCCLITGCNQLFYNTTNNAWIRADTLSVNDCIGVLNGTNLVVSHIEYKDKPIELYFLYVQDHHNFCITESEVVVHNFIPIIAGIAWVFGAGGIELASLGFSIAGTFIGYSLYKKHQRAHQNYNISIDSFSGGMFPEDPDDEDELTSEEKKIRRDQARETFEPLQNKDARQIATERGYKEVKVHPCGNTRGKPVFYNGKEYISPDADGHSGGVWKVFNRKGKILYAVDKILKRRCKIYK